MTDDLYEIAERLQISANDLDELHGPIEAYFQSALERRIAPIASRGAFALAKPPPQPTEVSLLARITKPVPTVIRVKAGQIANEIRACLDALACQLAIRNGKSPSGVYFPISASKAVFNDDGLKKIQKLSGEDRTKIESLTPYQGGNDTLYRLHQIDVRRKHIKLCTAATVSGIEVGGFGAGPGSMIMIDHCLVGDQPVTQMVMDGTAGLRLRDIGTFVQVASGVPPFLIPHANLNPRLVYDEPPAATGYDVLGVLHASIDAVRGVTSLFWER